MNKILVTGSSGFIAKQLIEKLLQRGYSVLGIATDKTDITHENFQAIMLDLSQEINLVVENVDCIIHLAWRGVSGQDFGNFTIQHQNVLMTMNVLEFAHKNNIKKFIFAGSISEYENSTLRKIHYYDYRNLGRYYSYAKNYAHQLCSTYCYEHNIHFNSLLISNVYGENENSKRFIISLSKAMMDNIPFEISECTQPYSFIYMDDALEMMVDVVQNNYIQDEIYIGSNESRSLKEFVEQIRCIINPSYKLEYGSKAGKPTKFQYDLFYSELSDKLATKYCKTSFAEGIYKIKEKLSNKDE